ncbi:MAG: hypothetical protein M3Y82_06715 [Verrucomicrobiota bacterium]|nr:hypothetical protein [Verrucomicrobiota bacterium]
MSARKIDISNSFSPTTSSGQTRLSLPANAVRLRKNGVEFLSDHALATWTEMIIDLESAGGKKIHCNGVVVACDGNHESGYNVSMLFTNIPRQSQALLNALA